MDFEKCGGVDSLILTIFGFGGSNDVVEAASILKNDSKNDVQEGLRTQILAALLNFVVGRGICMEKNLVLKQGEMCPNFNEAAMRTVIQNALVVLVNSGYTGVPKASSGSVGDNRDLLDRTN